MAGIIGAEGNPANLLYLGVLAVGLIGGGMARLQARGMAKAMFCTALAQVSAPGIALLIWRPSLEEPPGLVGIFILNGFFATLFMVSGLLFKRDAERGEERVS